MAFETLVLTTVVLTSLYSTFSYGLTQEGDVGHLYLGLQHTYHVDYLMLCLFIYL